MIMDNRDAMANIEQLAQAGMIDAAEQACRELLARDAREHKGWASLAMLKLVQHQPADAEVAIGQAIVIDSDDSRYWNVLSIALRLQSRFAEAVAASQQALARHQTSEHWAHLCDALVNAQR